LGGGRCAFELSRSGRRLVAPLEAVAATGVANEKWTDVDEVLRQCASVTGLL
jgi:hypothetical protein